MIITFHGVSGPLGTNPRGEVKNGCATWSTHSSGNQLCLYFHSIAAAEDVANAALSVASQMRAQAQHAEAAE